MRGRLVLLGLASAMVVVPTLDAQQKPIFGCNSAMSCRDRQLGYSAINGNPGGGVLFGAGVRFGPGFQFFFVTPRFVPTPTPTVDGPVFHLRASLLPPSLLAPTPTPTPAAIR